MHTTTEPTIWAVPDDVWVMIESIRNDGYPAKPTGHRRVDRRRVLNGISFRRRTGGQWHQLPTRFGDDSPVHRPFQQGCQCGILARLWAVLVEACDEWGGVAWQWQAADTAIGKARMGGDLGGRNPTDRGKKGENGVFSWTRREGPWAPPSPGPMSTTPSCWRPRWKPSWWSVPSRPRQSRRISVWTRAMTIRLGMRPWRHIRTSRISGASARKSSSP
jgi:transposase